MEVDKNAITPSDFGLIGNCPEFSDECDFSKEQIFNEVKEHFKSAYDVDDIEYVNVANDISNHFYWVAMLEEQLKYKSLLLAYFEEKGIQATDNLNIAYAMHADDWPKTSGCLCRECELNLDLDDIEKKIK